MRKRIFMVTALMALAGCDGGSGPATPDNRTAPAVPVDQPPANGAAPASAKAAEAVKIEHNEPLLDFAYGWPAQAAGIAPLDAWLRDNAKNLRVNALKSARSDQESAQQGGFPFHQHDYEESYAVAADVPRLLLLQSEGYVFTGGAHGTPISTLVLWDKARARRLAVSDLLDTRRMAAAATPAYCKALSVERTKKRGGEPAPVVDKDDPFYGCPALERQMIFPVSSATGKPLDRLRVYIGPYEAGPYSEGVYQMDLPMSAAMLAAVKPEWRGAFSGG